MVSAEMVEEVRSRLTALEAEAGVRVLFAAESGSRAWGFASADSDYDVRFVYAHQPDWYVSIDADSRRDTIERMLPGDIDLSGWEVRKALRLFAKSNPPLLEWLDSPTVYQSDPAFASAMRDLRPAVYSPRACLHHYLSMARHTARAYLGGPSVKWKKYFYLLRPLLAARWIEQGRGPVPMPFAALLTTIPDERDVLAAVSDLLARKAAAGEAATGPPVEAFHAFAAAELPRLAAAAENVPATQPDYAALTALFRRTVGV